MTDDRNYLLRISWPNLKVLGSNSRAHWAQKAKAVKAYREEAWAEAKHRGVTQRPDAVLQFYFYPPDNRKRDAHNMPAAMKAVIDGIADAMGCDDKGFRCLYPSAFEKPSKGGAVLVEIQGTADMSGSIM